MSADSAASAASAATRLLLVRHGQTAWNAAQRIQGHTDIALDATGLAQAERLAQALADETVDAIYSSDLQRALQTAAPFARAAGLPVHPEPLLRERHFGSFEGQTFDELRRDHPEDTLRWQRREPDFAPGGGETLLAFSARCVGAADAIARRHRGQTLLLVAHGGVLDSLYRAATRVALDAPRTWRLANAAINRLLHSEEGLVLVGWDDAGHLDDATS